MEGMGSTSGAGEAPRRPTIQNVADAAGVSRALVSIVFRDAPGASDATRARIRTVADQLGYRPDRRAQLLRQARTRTIGVSFAVHDAFHAELVEALYRVADDRGYSVNLSATTGARSEIVAAESLLADRPEAVILLGAALDVPGLAAVLESVPTVVVTRSAGGLADCVHTDDHEGGRLAAAHLFGLGHRAVHYLDAPRAAGADARLAGVLAAAASAQARVEVVDAGGDEEAGIRAATALLAAGELPTAVFAFNDRCAVGVLETFLRAGVRVPEQVSVVGYDDSRVAGLSVVSLTTVAQDAAAMARGAADFAIARIDDRAAPTREAVLPPALVVRGSTGPPR